MAEIQNQIYIPMVWSARTRCWVTENQKFEIHRKFDKQPRQTIRKDVLPQQREMEIYENRKASENIIVGAPDPGCSMAQEDTQ
jgi:hypothetical protein